MERNTVFKITKEEESDLAKISKASDEFNTRANEATQYIEEVENRLNETQVGTVVWLDSPVIRVTEKPLKLKQLGFARVDSVWGIAVKTPERLVRNSDRATRIAAAPLIPKLLELIVKEIETISTQVNVVPRPTTQEKGE